MDRNKELFEKYRKRLLRDCQQALSYWEVFKQLSNYISTHNDIINTSPGFFRIVKSALLEGVIVVLSKVMDQGTNDNLSVFSILRFAKSHPTIFAKCPKAELIEIAEHAETSLLKHDKVISHLKERRDKDAAHTDRRAINKGVPIAQSHPVLVGEIDALFKDVESVFNDISTRYDGHLFVFHIWSTSDLAQSVDLMEQGKRAGSEYNRP